jgi:hypothetical protein
MWLAGKEGFMSAIQRWVERDDARLAQKSTSWFVLRSFLGVLVLVKAAHFALTATGPLGYVLAALFTAGGLAWLIEGAQGARSRLVQKI